MNRRAKNIQGEKKGPEQRDKPLNFELPMENKTKQKNPSKGSNRVQGASEERKGAVLIPV